MLGFLDFLLDLLILGDTFISLRRITDGDAYERASPFYDTPAMRRCRLIARVVVLLYVAAIIALPIAAVVWIEADFSHEVYADRYPIVTILIYIALSWLGFWALRRIFRRLCAAIAARQST
jgi:hypothetical protein